jgi:hypothetical protein
MRMLYGRRHRFDLGRAVVVKRRRVLRCQRHALLLLPHRSWDLKSDQLVWWLWSSLFFAAAQLQGHVSGVAVGWIQVGTVALVCYWRSDPQSPHGATVRDVLRCLPPLLLLLAGWQVS